MFAQRTGLELMEGTEDRFAAGADYYRGRTAYSANFFLKLSRTLGLNKNSTILDLACGSGELTLGLSPFTGKIVGTDKSDAMLNNAVGLTPSNVRFFQHDLNQSPLTNKDRYDHVTIGRAIPYLRPRELEITLSNTLKDGGGVIITGAGLGAETAWLSAYQEIRRRFTRKKGRLDFRGVQTMNGIGFALTEGVNDIIEVEYCIDDIVAHALSFPTQTQALLDDIDAFRSTLEDVLMPFANEREMFLASEHSWALIFRRTVERPTEDRSAGGSRKTKPRRITPESAER